MIVLLNKNECNILNVKAMTILDGRRWTFNKNENGFVVKVNGITFVNMSKYAYSESVFNTLYIEIEHKC